MPLNGEILHLIETPASLATSQRVLSDRAVQSSRDRRLSCGGTTVRLYARPDAASLVVTIYRSVGFGLGLVVMVLLWFLVL